VRWQEEFDRYVRHERILRSSECRREILDTLP
jgi:hypothetical protein